MKAVFLDVGETLVEEERYWRQVAAMAGIEAHVVLAALGVTIALSPETSRPSSSAGREPRAFRSTSSARRRVGVFASRRPASSSA